MDTFGVELLLLRFAGHPSVAALRRAADGIDQGQSQNGRGLAQLPGFYTPPPAISCAREKLVPAEKRKRLETGNGCQKMCS